MTPRIRNILLCISFRHSAVPIYDISYHKSDECLSHSHNKYLKSLISTSLKVASCAPGLVGTEQVTGNSHFGVYCHPLTMHGSFLFMPCGTTFLWVLISAVFPAIRKNRYRRQIKITTNIFSRENLLRHKYSLYNNTVLRNRVFLITACLFHSETTKYWFIA